MRKHIPEENKRIAKVVFMTTEKIAESLQKEADKESAGKVGVFLHSYFKKKYTD